MRLAGHIAGMEDKRCAYKIMIEKREEKRLLGRPRCRWRTMLNIFYRKRMGNSGLYSSGSE